MTKRSLRKLIFFLAAFSLAAPFASAQQNSSAAIGSSSAPAAAGQQGTGVVPPGVTLDPRMPPVGAPGHFEFPKATVATLPNGLRIFVVTDHREPAVAARLVILSAGAIKDPRKMPGVATMTANLLTQGTEKRSARDIAESIDFIGGSLSAAAGKDFTDVTLDVVKKDLDTGLDLMSDVVLHPAFKSDELDRQRQQLLSGLEVQYADPDYLASLVFDRTVYGVSPYGWPSEGTPDSVRKFQREDFVKFHNANYAPNRSLLAFAGDITPEEAMAAAQKYFGSWAAVPVSGAEPAAPAPVSGMRIWLVDKPDAVQTQIRVGRLGIARADHDFIPVAVMNRIFGGGYNSRLNTEVRVKKGLTYGANSAFNPHAYAGDFVASTFTRTQATVEATKLVVDLIAQMSSGSVTPAEMDFARDYLAGVYPIQSETAEQVADRVLTVAAYGLPDDYNTAYPEEIRAVTASQVQAMAQRYLSKDSLDIVLAGNVSAFRDALKKEFPTAQYHELPFDRIDVLAPDLRKPKEDAATPQTIEQGRQILLAAATAAGGQSLLSVSTLAMTEDGKLTNANGESPVHVEWIVSYPDRSHGNVTFGGQKIAQVCDGKSAWLQFPQQTVDVTANIGEFERGIALFGGGWGLYQQVLAGKITGHFIGEEEIAGKNTEGVAVQASFGAAKLYFDKDTHLLAAARYQSSSPEGASDNEQRWSDYRAVDGRQFAYWTSIYRDGAKFTETSLQDVRFNVPADASLFVKPGEPAR